MILILGLPKDVVEVDEADVLLKRKEVGRGRVSLPTLRETRNRAATSATSKAAG